MKHWYNILQEIDSEDYTDNEKGAAIYKMLDLETHNSITKKMLLGVVKYLFELCFDVEKVEQAAGERENKERQQAQ